MITHAQLIAWESGSLPPESVIVRFRYAPTLSNERLLSRQSW